MTRREFITLLGGAAVAWPLAVRAQQPTPIVGLINGRSAQDAVRNVAAFRKGLDDTGYVEGQNVMVEYHWVDGQYHRLPSLVDDLVRRRVAVIATPCVPGVHALLEHRDVLVVRHGSTPIGFSPNLPRPPASPQARPGS